MRLAFKIAWRFLKSNKGQTLLIALGIGVGISVQIFIGSLINGLQASLIDATIGQASHITLEPVDKKGFIEDYSKIDAFVKAYDLSATTPSLSQGAFIQVQDNYTQVFFRGFPLDRADAIYDFKSRLVGKGQLPLGDEILVGKIIARDQDLEVGDQVKLIPAQGQGVLVTVSGIIDFKVNALNEQWVIGSLNLAYKTFEIKPGSISSFESQLEDPFLADQLAEQMDQDLADETVSISNWKIENEQLLAGLTGQSSSSYLIQVFVVISVVLGIASVLAISVLQKSKQIGILKAMGIKNSTASQIFLLQGLILGIMGGLLGIGLGLGLLFAFSSFALNPDGSPVVPILIEPGFILLSGCIAVLASTGAAILPALKSKKLSPIEVIRNG